MNTLGHEQAYRGTALLNKMARQGLVFCGCGAIGSNFIDNAVRQGFKQITVIDMDRIEDQNRHTQVWDRRSIGQYKAAMMMNKVFESMGIQINPVSKRLDQNNVKKLLPTGSIIIDGFDNSASRQIIQDHCRASKIDCLHVGLFENYAEIIWDEKYNVPGDAATADICDYPLARNVILLAVATATEVLIRYLETDQKEDYTITLKDFKILRRD